MKDNVLFIVKIISALLILYGSFHGGQEKQKTVSNEQMKTLGQVIQILSGDCKQ